MGRIPAGYDECKFIFFCKLDLPSFLWLWKIAAWSMGFSVLAYVLLAASGGFMFWIRTFSPKLSPTAGYQQNPIAVGVVRSLHYAIGWILVALVLLLLGIGIVGTLGHYGNLGHSPHLLAGLMVVALVLCSAGTASQISPERPWAKPLHISINALLFFGLSWVSWTGWTVVQKYLP
jgi:Protein of unknown function (DUF4079)